MLGNTGYRVLSAAALGGIVISDCTIRTWLLFMSTSVPVGWMRRAIRSIEILYISKWLQKGLGSKFAQTKHRT